MSDSRFKFRIPIGDWSGDGHGQCEWFTASSNGDIKAVREAYFKAKELVHERFHPDNFVCDYEDRDLPSDVYVKMMAEGIVPMDFDPDMFHTEEMAKYVVWFLNQGNPTLEVQLAEEEDDMLAFYGYDEKKRHIRFIGYGLLGS